jgi:hypothetical protein
MVLTPGKLSARYSLFSNSNADLRALDPRYGLMIRPRRPRRRQILGHFAHLPRFSHWHGHGAFAYTPKDCQHSVNELDTDCP